MVVYPQSGEFWRAKDDHTLIVKIREYSGKGAGQADGMVDYEVPIEGPMSKELRPFIKEFEPVPTAPVTTPTPKETQSES